MGAMNSEALISKQLTNTLSSFVLSYNGLTVPLGYHRESAEFPTTDHGGKQSPDYYQSRLDAVIDAAANKELDVGIETADELRLRAARFNLGIDCSGLAYYLYQDLFDRLGLAEFATVVGIPLETAEGYLEADSEPVGVRENKRALNSSEKHDLRRLINRAKDSGHTAVELKAVAGLLKKTDPVYMASAARMSHSHTMRALQPEEAPQAGDAVVFWGHERQHTVEHIGVLTEPRDTGYDASDTWSYEFGHSWHSRGLDSGVATDTVHVKADSEGVPRPVDFAEGERGVHFHTRYDRFELRRPIVIGELTLSRAQSS